MGDQRFSARQRRLLQHLLTAPSVREAAKGAKVSETQAYRIVTMPRFAAEWDRLRKESLALALSRAQQEAAACVSTLCEIRDDARAPNQARVNAATKILEMAEQGRLEDAAQQRIARLEAGLAQLQHRSDDDEQQCLPAAWREDDTKGSDHA